MNVVFIGLGVGFVFGIILFKAKMLSYDNQVATMQLKNMMLFKYFMSAQLVGSICLTILYVSGYIGINHLVFNAFNSIIGGLIFGVGWGMLGYCPGTCTGAAATGKIDSVFGLIGITLGCILGTKIIPHIAIFTNIFNFGNIGVTNKTSLIISTIILSIVYLIIFRIFEKKKL
ncbi:MAG: hypothetical protein RL017_779 [Pseudomonadota bacterium]|jgi:uncharacterized membrane protein YedE/YeeE|nr:YeeE/YedE thiosulfate transporter family protein [Burkholderiales bacterium]